MSTEKNPASHATLQIRNCILESGAIFRCISRAGRAMRPALPKWQITTQYRETTARKRLRHGDQQRSLTVRSRAVSQHKTVAVRMIRGMQKSTHWRIARHIRKSLEAACHTSSSVS